MIYIECNSSDVYYNFGAEYYFALEKAASGYGLSLLADHTDFDGREYQNVLEEVNKPYADAHGIRLVRRMSGGGTIYTDLGGWQFTFIQHDGEKRDCISSIYCAGNRCAAGMRRRGCLERPE